MKHHTISPSYTLPQAYRLQCYKVGQSVATFFEDLTLMRIASNLISNVIICLCTITYMAREMLRTATCLWFFGFSFYLLLIYFVLCSLCVCQHFPVFANAFFASKSCPESYFFIASANCSDVNNATLDPTMYRAFAAERFLAVWDSEIGSDSI